MSNRRTATQREIDRERLVLSTPRDRWVRVPEGTPRSDVDAMVKVGHLETEVRREFDKQGGNYSHALFGGAGVVMRRRLYIRRTPQGTVAKRG